jgi:uncharacterized protein YggE
MKAVISLAAFFCLSSAFAQTSSTPPPFVRAVGQGSVSVKPDQAKIDFSVVTTASTAQDAAATNAAQVTTLLAALDSLLGANANIQTIGYSLNPNYNYPPNGNPVLTGYTASNTIEVSTGDLSAPGSIIDTGVKAGATNVQSLQFTLQNPDPARQQALKLATAQARAHADAMASGAGLHTGAVNSIQEQSSTNAPPVSVVPGTSGTPVLPGLVFVQATVILEVQLTP